MVEEANRKKANHVYYMSTNGNGTRGKMLVKTTCEKLPQLQTAKSVSIAFSNKQLYKKNQPEIESKLRSNQSATMLPQGHCNGHNCRFSGNLYHCTLTSLDQLLLKSKTMLNFK